MKDYKKAIELLFKVIEKQTKAKIYNIKDEGLDHGYVEFAVSKCKNYRFAIHLYDEARELVHPEDYVQATVHTQYEDLINKFKPEESQFMVDHIYINLVDESLNEKDNNDEIYAVSKMIEYIHDEPLLAFCRDYCGWNYNEKYHTREEAKMMYQKYLFKKQLEKQIKKLFDSKMINLYNTRILPLFNDAYLDYNEDNYHAYTVIIPLEKNTDLFKEEGIYRLADINERVGKAYDDLVEVIKLTCWDYEYMHWHNDFDDCIEVRKESDK